MMGRAAAGDNAAMESFNALLQKNVLDRQRWTTRAQLRYEIIRWIEHTYNRRRRQRRLGRLTPVECELAFAHEAATQQPSTEPAAVPSSARPRQSLNHACRTR